MAEQQTNPLGPIGDALGMFWGWLGQVGTFILQLLGFQITKEEIYAPSLSQFVMRIVEVIAIAIIIYFVLRKIGIL